MAPRAESCKDRQLRNPIDHLTHGLPRQWRIAIDWAVTILGAVAIVLAIKAYVVNPYRIPSSSMEPTLHCARPGNGCEARFSDRVLANRFIYHFRDPKRSEIVVFKTPPAAQVACSGVVGGTGGDTFVKRLVGLPGDRWRVQDGFVYINGEKLDEPYVKPERRDAGHDPGEDHPEGRVPDAWRQPLFLVRLASLGDRSQGQPHRPCVRHLLATGPPRLQIGLRGLARHG